MLSRTTFVLGAGASRDAGYPFAKDMGRGLLEWMEQAEDEGSFQYRAVAKSFRDSFDNAEDIEALLMQMQIAQVTYEFRVLIQGLRRWFEQISRTPSNSYRLFASNVVRPGDSVITFNYDVSLDQELRRSGIWELGDGYGFDVEGFAASSKVKLLKLHGSINWRALVFGGRRSGIVDLEHSLGRRPVFCDSDLKTLGYEREVDCLLPRAGGAMVDSLILPVREKQFFFQTSLAEEWGSFWDSLWDAAAKSLQSSDRIVICGYSVLPIDERACGMLLKDPEIKALFEVCCGNNTAEIVDRLKSSGCDAYAAKHLLFSEWVQANA